MNLHHQPSYQHHQPGGRREASGRPQAMHHSYHQQQQLVGGPQARNRAGSYTQHGLPRAHKLGHAHPHPTTSQPNGLRAMGGVVGKTALKTKQSQAMSANTKNSRVQFLSPPEGYSDKPHPLLIKSGIPMRATRSAQTPNDALQLTSYPRSHTEAMQRRSASNGRVQPHPHLHTGPAGHTHLQAGQRTKLSYQYVGGMAGQHGSYGNSAGNNNEMIGSLV